MSKETHSFRKQLVMKQFGDNAVAYETSIIHSRGQSLSRLIDLLQPEPNQLLLDIATAAGHTAHTIAPYVRKTVAVDITFDMLSVASAGAKRLGLDNVMYLTADAEQLPFAHERFDLVTCRIAAHHFPQVELFMAEVARVLKPGGKLAVVDNIVPGSAFSGRKQTQGRDVGRYVNAFERLRDPSHVSCLSLESWQEQFYAAGFQILHHETSSKEMDLSEWAARMKVSQVNTTRLKVMLLQAPEEVVSFLLPEIHGQQIKFRLTEMLMMGKLWHA